MRIAAVDAFLVDIPFRVPFVVWRGTAHMVSARKTAHGLLPLLKAASIPRCWYPRAISR